MNELTEERRLILSKAGIVLKHLTEEQITSLINRNLDPESITENQLVEFVQVANATYRAGNPIISDAEYDLTFLADLRSRNPNHPYLKSVEPESAFEGKTVELPVQMLSTEKKYSKKEVIKWIKSIDKVAKDVGLDLERVEIRVTPKLDGFAAYDDGERLYTRGDGRTGTDISRVFDRGLPVANDGKRGQGAGEIVVTKSYFEKHLAEKFDNTRNFQASIIREKTLDPSVELAIKNKAAVFFPFASLPSWEGGANEFLEQFDDIINTVWNSVDYDVDGVIIEVTNDSIKSHLGATRHHHRWQIAFKENTEKAIVKVLDVHPHTSRSGRVNPVAELEATRLSGATIRSVTVHHYKMVKDKKIGPGAVIELIRSGLVIPKIEKVIETVDPKIPENCPSCDSKLIWENDYLLCTNTTDCPAQIENTLEHFFKTIKHIDGFGPQTIKTLYKHGIKTVYDIYTLDKPRLIDMGFSEKKVAQNLLDQLSRSRSVPIEDWRFLAAFGVYRMGPGMCERLLEHFHFEDIFRLTEEKIATVEGFAKITATAVVSGLNRIEQRFWALHNLGFNIQRTAHITDGLELENSPIAGKLIVFTGSMKSGSRDEMKKQAKALGAKIGSSITGKTNLLVIGENVGIVKLEEAKKLNINIVTEDKYLELISKTQKEPSHMDTGKDIKPQLKLF